MDEENTWKEKALEVAEVLKKVSQPPLQYATVIQVDNDTVDVALSGGNTYVVHYNPRLKDRLRPGQTVQLMPETMAVINIAGSLKTRNNVVVKDILPDGRIKIEDQGRERVIFSTVDGIKVGDEVLTDSSNSVVLERVKQSKSYHVEKVPEVRWDSIGGLEQTIEEIRDTVELPFLHRDIYRKFPNKKPAKGILLYGPPGCGKTMLGKALAYNLASRHAELNGGETNGYFLYTAGPEFLQKFVGTGEEKVRKLFAGARETTSINGDPVVLFIDEPETILRQRGTGISSDATDSLVNQFLVEMDGLNPLENIVVLLATNREDLLDGAIVRPGRIDRKIYVPRPNRDAAAAIFNIYLSDIPLEKKVGQSRETTQKEMTEYAASEVFDVERPILRITYNDGKFTLLEYKHIFSGASVVSIVGRATDYAIKRAIKGKKAELKTEDLSAAVNIEYLENRSLTNQVTPDDIRRLAKDKYEFITDVRPAYNGSSK
ncbi:MAG TPA: AAA family ATPase [Candidatus Nanoarchaeia archaeon]|nr:AAA family ATPase [Candidatus Nanoarchaeia archaeon]